MTSETSRELQGAPLLSATERRGRARENRVPSADGGGSRNGGERFAVQGALAVRGVNGRHMMVARR